MTELLSTKRLVLRSAELSDDNFIYHIMNDPSWLNGIGDRGIHDLSCARLHIRDSMQQSYQDRGFGMYIVSRLEQTNVPIGLCGLIDRPGLEHIDIGYALLPQFTGQGFALEAAQAMLKHGLDTLGIEKIIAITAESNTRSALLLEKLGMHFRKMIQLPGSQEKSRLFY